MSELDDDFDYCGDCENCGSQVQEAGSHLCDGCAEEDMFFED